MNGLFFVISIFANSSLLICVGVCFLGLGVVMSFLGLGAGTGIKQTDLLIALQTYFDDCVYFFFVQTFLIHQSPD